MSIRESAENYLETILILSKKLSNVRSIDIATELGYSKPSVSVAMKNLRQRGYIEVSEGGSILLTESGRAAAQSVFERHHTITEFLTALGVPHDIAAEDACKMEHIISNESFEALKKFALCFSKDEEKEKR